MAADDRVGVRLGDLLDLDAALGRAHQQDPPLGPVEDGREVELLDDVGGRADQDLADGHALDVHAEDRRRRPPPPRRREPASFTPPALPRPPTSTWALMTTLPAPVRRGTARAAARASSTVWATSQAGTGRPWATSSDLASASWIFTGGRGPPATVGTGARWYRVRPPGTGSRHRFGNEPRRSPRHTQRAWPDGPPSPRGDMQRDLVERARKGDHDAFAELAGAAISRLDGAAWLILRDAEQAKDAVQNTLVRPGVTCPRSAIRTASTPGSTGSSSVPASMRRAGSAAIGSMSSSPTLHHSGGRRRRIGRRRPRPARTRLPPARSGDAGRRSSCITTSTSHCRPSRRPWGSPSAPRSRVCTAPSG